jgi:hypothetical protein
MASSYGLAILHLARLRDGLKKPMRRNRIGMAPSR